MLLRHRLVYHYLLLANRCNNMHAKSQELHLSGQLLRGHRKDGDTGFSFARLAGDRSVNDLDCHRSQKAREGGITLTFPLLPGKSGPHRRLPEAFW